MFLFLARLGLLLAAALGAILFAAAAIRGTGHLHLLNVPFPVRLWPLYLALCVAAAALWFLSLRRADWRVLFRPRLWPSRLRERHIVAALLLLKVAVVVFICRRGFLFLSSDDFCRIDIAYRWREHPFFATWDHVWLAGQFYVQGAFMWLLRDPMIAVRLSSLLFSLGYALVFYRLARDVFGRWTAYLSLAILAVLPYPAWLSVSGHPNPFFMAFSLLGIWLLVTGRGRWPHLAGAAAAFCAASALRYEGLLLGGVFAVWNLLLLLSDRRRWTAKAVTAHALLCLLPFAYIAAWSVSCYLEFGDAFRFFRTAYGFAPPWVTDMDVFGRLLWYPRVLAGGTISRGVENRLSAAVFLLGLTGIPASIAFAGRARPLVLRYTFVALLNFAFLMGTVITGGANLMAQRVVVLSQVLLLPFVAALFFAAWDRAPAWLPRRWGRWVPAAAKGLLVIAVAALLATELGKTLHFPRRMRGVDPATLKMAETLHRRFLDRDPAPQHVAAVLIDGRAGWERSWVLAVMGRRIEKTHLLARRWQPRIRAVLAQDGHILFVSCGGPPPEGIKARRLDRIGRHALWALTDTDPSRTLSLLEPRFLNE